MPLDKIDLLIMKALVGQPLHGYGIGQRITQLSGGEIRITLGSLYPALQRLERAAIVSADWRASDHNRRARYYALTPHGRRRLAAGQRAWRRGMAAVMRVLEA